MMLAFDLEFGGDADQVLSTLRELLRIQFPVVNVRDEDIARIIRNGSSKCTFSDIAISDFSQLLHNIFSKQKTISSDPDIRNELLATAIEYLFKAFQASGTQHTKFTVLRSLSSVLFENGPSCQQSVNEHMPHLEAGDKKFKKSSAWGGSDSEASDSEGNLGGVGSYKGRNVPLHALNCLQAAIKANPKAMYPKWGMFLSEFRPKSPTLFSMLKDEGLQPSVKVAVAGVIMAFLDGSKQYLSVAEEKKAGSKSSFMSLSEKLSLLIANMHVQLIDCMKVERTDSVLASEVKCAIQLVSNTPYDKLSHDYRYDLFEYAHSILGTPDIDLRCAALELIRCLIEAGLSLSGKSQSKSLKSPVSIAIESVSVDNTFIRICALNLLTTAAGSIGEDTTSFWKDIQPLLDRHFADSNEAIRSLVMKILEKYSMKIATELDRELLTKIGEKLVPMIKAQDLGIRIRSSWALANLCGSLSGMDTETADEDNEVAHASGVDNSATTTNGSPASESSKRSYLLPESVASIYLKCAIHTANDNDKCRPNGVRAIGYLFSICPESLLQGEMEGDVKDAVVAVIRSMESGPFKQRWNAAHAAGHVLKSDTLPIERSTWRRPLFIALTNAIATSKNFKVRINAAAALSVPVRMSQYGGRVEIENMMEVIRTARQKSDDLTGSAFGEFRYREQFLERLTQTETHLAQMLSSN
ncbi:HEAT repeat-containing protein 6 [Chytridiales sp. JEL 0842]|nr:HEAT repeat-containing protein 6 [Chytridiales sp. JEL 0842]